jgi:streptogramin lyase
MNRWVVVHRPAALFAVLIVGCAAPGAGSPSESAEASPSAAASSAAASPSGPPTVALEDRVAAELQIAGADFPIAAFDSVWVVSQDQAEPAIVRIDPATNEIAATIPVTGRGCQGMAAGFGSVWACSDDGIVRIDPETNAVASVLDLPAVGVGRLAASDEGVWAFTSSNALELPDGLLRIDPRTEKAVTIPLGHPAGQMTFAYGALWVTSPADGLLLRVDPASGEVTKAVAELETPNVVTAGLDSLWVTLYGDRDATPEAGASTIVRLDPATLEVQGELAAGPMSTTGEVAADETGVWVRNSTVFLTRHDPETYEPLEVIESSQGGGAVLLAYDSVWATSYDYHGVWRFDP